MGFDFFENPFVIEQAVGVHRGRRGSVAGPDRGRSTISIFEVGEVEGQENFAAVRYERTNAESATTAFGTKVPISAAANPAAMGQAVKYLSAGSP